MSVTELIKQAQDLQTEIGKGAINSKHLRNALRSLNSVIGCLKMYERDGSD